MRGGGGRARKQRSLTGRAARTAISSRSTGSVTGLARSRLLDPLHACAERTSDAAAQPSLGAAHGRAAHRPGQRGSGVLLRQLASIPLEGRVPDSWFEESWRLPRRSRLQPVEPQYPIRDASAASSPGRTSRFRPFGSASRPTAGSSTSALTPSHSTSAHLPATCGWELLYLGWYAAYRPARCWRPSRRSSRSPRRELRRQRGHSAALTSHFARKVDQYR